MRKILKGTEPQVLIDNKESWKSALQSNPSNHNKNKYRHPDIKKALRDETCNKCVYCESKIGFNCPGDIEHKIPKSKEADLIFEWNNMTIACNECNRRKSDYYDSACMFLDPYTDNVEGLVLHYGPFVVSLPGNKRSEVTVLILELSLNTTRKSLIGRKIEKLESIKHLIERIAVEDNAIIKDFLQKTLLESCSISAEYSGMVKTFVELFPNNWDRQ